MAHRGYFVIADITGYTAFLTGSELEHAQDILKTLFDTMLKTIRPPLLISNFQGDAILTYAPEGSFNQGQTLLEKVETIYGEFAHKLELMQMNTTCPCKACANMGSLDLKLFVHYGEYVLQDMGGKAELSGSDVIIAHRMMKNAVKEKTGLQAYALFSEAAVNALGLQDFTCEMTPHTETYEHIGDVKMYAYCLKTMWEKEREKRRVLVAPEEAWFTVEADIPASPAVVWDYLNDPQLRLETMRGGGVEGVTLTDTTNGRIGKGSVYHCAHGGDANIDLIIVDWQPFDYVTEDMVNLPMRMSARNTTRLTPTPDGTHVAFSMTRVRSSSPILHLISRFMLPMIKRKVSANNQDRLSTLRKMLEAKGSHGARALAGA